MKLQKMVTLTTLAALSTVAVASTSFAEENGADKTTVGKISFVPDDGITPPTDPEKPEKPIIPIDPWDPEKPVDPGTPGPLSIDFASSFNFGEQKITSKDATYTAAAQMYTDENGEKQTGPNFVQVTDNRGSEAGWTLQVKQMKQFESEKNSLTGAVVKITQGHLVTNSESGKPTAVETIVLDGETASLSTVLSAKKGEGAGTHKNTFGTAATADKAVELSVPGKTTKFAQQYETSFNWVLTDAPGV